MPVKLKPEVKEKWVAALRSGEYKQGRGCLHNKNNAFCCLGVLSDISGLGRWTPLDEVSGNFRSYETAKHKSSGFLLPEVWEWAVVDSRKGTATRHSLWVGGSKRENIASLNDRGKSFAEIADLIEEHL